MSAKFLKIGLLIFVILFKFSCFCQQDNIVQESVKKEEKVIEIKPIGKIDALEVKKDNPAKKRLEEIRKEKRVLKSDLQKKETALRVDKKEWKLALETHVKSEFEKVEKRLESLELKFEINKLKKERDFIKKYEREGLRKARLHKLKILEKELEESKYLGKKNKSIDKKVSNLGLKEKRVSSEEVKSIKPESITNKKLLADQVNKDLNKVKKEIDIFEKISQKGYAKNRLTEIYKKIEALNARSMQLNEKSSEPKKYNKHEIKSNLDKIDQELRYLQSHFRESVSALEKEEVNLR